MNKVEKKFKEYMQEQIHVKDSYQDIAKRIDFEEGEKNMSKKKLIPILCGGLTVAVVAGVCVFALGGKGNVEPKARGIVTVDVNPSIELVVDDENKVISVTGLNDDGKMIIVNEKIVGEDLNTALETIITIENETGFLISGKAEASENEIKISVSADTEAIINEIETDVKTSIATVCDELKINEKVEEFKKYNRELLEQHVLEIDPTLEETISEMTYEELLKVVAVHQLETTDIYSQRLEELYLEAKNYEISFSEKDSIKTLISDMDSIYQSFLVAYSELVESLKTVSSQLESVRYDLLVDPESSYQEALVKVSEAKGELAALKQEYANTENPSILLKAEITIKETALDTVSSALETVENTANLAIDGAQEAVEKVIATLEEKEAEFPAEIQTQLTNKAKDIETNMNTAKDEFFTSFEAKYSEDIQRIKEDVANRKQALIDSLKGE